MTEVSKTNNTQSNLVQIWSCAADVSPSAAQLRQFIAGAESTTIGALAVPPVLLLVMLVLFVDEMVFFIRDGLPMKRIRYCAWILGAFPILGSLHVAVLFMPATASVLSFASSFYFAILLKKYFEYVLILYGGKKAAVETLSGELVVAHNPIPCCFVCCCRNQPMTLSRVNKLQVLTDQATFVFPLLYFIETLLAVEGITSKSKEIIAFSALEAVGTLSTLLVLYSFVVLSKASQNALKQFQVQLLHSYIFVCELFLFSILAWFAFRRSEEGCKVMTVHNVPSVYKKTEFAGMDEIINGNRFSGAVTEKQKDEECLPHGKSKTCLVHSISMDLLDV